MYAIEARDLHKSFRGICAVDGVSLAVQEGEVVGLLGPNGAGKTTTLMMLLGVTEPDQGEARLLGHRLPQERSNVLGRVGFHGTYVGFPGRMRLWEIFEVFARLYEAPRSRIQEMVDLFDLGELMSSSYTNLSSGQRTIAGLAKAMLHRPQLLILDEPTASLDPEVAARIRGILMEMQARDAFTILVTSHNMAEIERMCRRVVFMAGGRIVADGPPAEITARYGAEDLEGCFLSIAQESRV